MSDAFNAMILTDILNKPYVYVTIRLCNTAGPVGVTIRYVYAYNDTLTIRLRLRLVCEGPNSVCMLRFRC